MKVSHDQMHALKPRQKVELLMQKGKAIPNFSLYIIESKTLLG